jgi:ribosomal protein S9
LSGASISGGFAIALYFLTSSIAQTFAKKPLTSTSPVAINISIAIRTLVVGVSTLATAIFAIVALGLVAVAIQSLVQQLKNRKASTSDAQ